MKNKMQMNRRAWIALLAPFATAALGSAFLLVFPRASSPAPYGSAVTASVVQAANAFLATLTDAEQTKCTFGFTSSQRTGWSNLPTGIFQRNGLRFGDMTARQREAALALVAAALSREGYQKVTNIMNGDEVLKNAGRRADRWPPRSTRTPGARRSRRRHSLRTGRILHCAARDAVHNRPVDDSIRRASSCHQCHHRGPE